MNHLNYVYDIYHKIYDKICLLFHNMFFAKKIEPTSFKVKCVVYVVFVIWGLSFLDQNNFEENPYGVSTFLIGGANLAFHEAGHFIFMIFGYELLLVAGGSLMQCIVPLVVVVQFLRQKDNFESSIALWWLGQNFLDVAPYIYDAWDKKLTLLGGHTGQDDPDSHDWHFILSETGYLQKYDEIAYFMVRMGTFTLFLSFVWGGYILYKQYHGVKESL